MANMYTCSFCGKKAEGKPLQYLVPSARYNPYTGEPVPLNGTSVSLRPEGWDWDIVPGKFTDCWDCGCHGR